MRTGFITGGHWCVDRNMTIARWPKEDTASYPIDVLFANGGSGSNLAIGMRKLDPKMPVETICLVGDDDHGRLLFDLTVKYGIKNDQFHRQEGLVTATTDAYQSLESGLRTHIGFHGTNALLTPDHFDLGKTEGKILHLGLPGTMEKMDGPWQGEVNGWVHVLKQAKQLGLVTNMELITTAPEKLRAIVSPCLPFLDLLVVNDFEIGALAQQTVSKEGGVDLAACRQAIKSVLEKGAMQLIAVHFVTGALVITRQGQEIFVPSVAVPDHEHIGPNGAGDAFAAGFLYGFHEGWDLEPALRLAHASAAACLRSISTVETMLCVKDALALADEWGWRS